MPSDYHYHFTFDHTVLNQLACDLNLKVFIQLNLEVVLTIAKLVSFIKYSLYHTYANNYTWQNRPKFYFLELTIVLIRT